MEFEKQAKVNWLSFKTLFLTGVAALVAKLASRQRHRHGWDVQGKSVDEGLSVGDLTSKAPFYFDYVADLGDGFNATHTVAMALSRPALSGNKLIANQTAMPSTYTEIEDLPRGEMLVMGGDLVYPIAHRDAYRDRLHGPYHSASRPAHESCTTDSPTLLAIPGNHDWYDSLSAFMGLIATQRRIGIWQTKQSRSYFSVALPHHCYVLGFDTQFNEYIDQPQLDYFRHAVKQMPAGSRIILVAAAPYWIEAASEQSPDKIRNLAYLKRLIAETNSEVRVVANITGDLHHFAHYICDDEPGSRSTTHYITCGGGGAYTHITHQLPVKMKVVLPASLIPEDHSPAMTLNAAQETQTESELPRPEAFCYPRERESKQLVWGIYRALLTNWHLWGLFAFFYLLMLASMQTDADIADSCGASVFEFKNLLVGNCSLWAWTWHDWTTWFVAGLFWFFAALFHTPAPRQETAGIFIEKAVGGLIHALFHLVVLWGFIALLPTTPPRYDSTWWLAFLVGMALASMGATLAMALYLHLSLHLSKSNEHTVASAIGSECYKSFLRFRVTPEQIDIYVIGIDESITQWEEDKTKEGKASGIAYLPWHQQGVESAQAAFEDGYQLVKKIVVH